MKILQTNVCKVIRVSVTFLLLAFPCSSLFPKNVILSHFTAMLSMQQSVAALLGIAIIFAIKNSAVGYKGWCLKSQSQFPRRSFALRMGTQKSNEQKSIYSEFLERFGLSQEKADQRGHTTKNTQQSELKVKKEERTPLDNIRRGSRCSGRIVSIRRYDQRLFHIPRLFHNNISLLLQQWYVCGYRCLSRWLLAHQRLL